MKSLSFAAKINTIWSGRKGPGQDEEGKAAEAGKETEWTEWKQRGQVRADHTGGDQGIVNFNALVLAVVLILQ